MVPDTFLVKFCLFYVVLYLESLDFGRAFLCYTHKQQTGQCCVHLIFITSFNKNEEEKNHNLITLSMYSRLTEKMWAPLVAAEVSTRLAGSAL